MNNHPYNPSERPEEAAPSRQPRSFLPLAVLLAGLFGLLDPSWAVAAVVLGLADRHLSGSWDGKTVIGLICGSAILLLILLLTVGTVILYECNPSFFSSSLPNELRLLAESTKAMLSQMGR